MFEQLRHFSDRRRDKNRNGRQFLRAHLRGFAEKLMRYRARSAELEKIIVYANRRATEQLLPDRSELVNEFGVGLGGVHVRDLTTKPTQNVRNPCKAREPS